MEVKPRISLNTNVASKEVEEIDMDEIDEVEEEVEEPVKQCPAQGFFSKYGILIIVILILVVVIIIVLWYINRQNEELPKEVKVNNKGPVLKPISHAEIVNSTSNEELDKYLNLGKKSDNFSEKPKHVKLPAPPLQPVKRQMPVSPLVSPVVSPMKQQRNLPVSPVRSEAPNSQTTKQSLPNSPAKQQEAPRPDLKVEVFDNSLDIHLIKLSNNEEFVVSSMLDNKVEVLSDNLDNLTKDIYPVNQMNMKGNVIATFQNKEELESHGFDEQLVADCCAGKSKTHKKYKWQKNVGLSSPN